MWKEETGPVEGVRVVVTKGGQERILVRGAPEGQKIL